MCALAGVAEPQSGAITPGVWASTIGWWGKELRAKPALLLTLSSQKPSWEHHPLWALRRSDYILTHRERERDRGKVLLFAESLFRSCICCRFGSSANRSFYSSYFFYYNCSCGVSCFVLWLSVKKGAVGSVHGGSWLCVLAPAGDVCADAKNSQTGAELIKTEELGSNGCASHSWKRHNVPLTPGLRRGILESDSLVAVNFTAFLRTEEIGNARFL